KPLGFRPNWPEAGLAASRAGRVSREALHGTPVPHSRAARSLGKAPIVVLPGFFTFCCSSMSDIGCLSLYVCVAHPAYSVGSPPRQTPSTNRGIWRKFETLM